MPSRRRVGEVVRRLAQGGRPAPHEIQKLATSATRSVNGSTGVEVDSIDPASWFVLPVTPTGSSCLVDAPARPG
jgi:hypothetical protein